MLVDPNDADAYVSLVFDQVVSGDQVGADFLKAQLTGCYSFTIPPHPAETEQAALDYLGHFFKER